MRLPRPYIRLGLRLKVATRAAIHNGMPAETVAAILRKRAPLEEKLADLLQVFDDPFELDHDPPLSQRRKLYNKSGRINGYQPAHDDPAYLVYRLKDDHRTKTYLRGDGAQRSDVSQQRYLKRIATRKKPRTKFKPRKAKHIRRSHATQRHGDKA